MVAPDLRHHVLNVPVERATIAGRATPNGAEAKVQLRHLVIGHDGRQSQLARQALPEVDGLEDKALARQPYAETVDQRGSKGMGVAHHGIAVGLVVGAVLAHGGVGEERVAERRVLGRSVADEERV